MVHCLSLGNLQMFTGVYEQNFIAHAMMFATCLGPDDLLKNPQCADGAMNIFGSFWLVALTTVITICN